MKKNIYFFGLLALLGVAGCSSGDDSTGATNTFPSLITAQINGTAFTTLSPTGSSSASGRVEGDHLVLVGGTFAGGRNLRLYIPKETGTFIFNSAQENGYLRVTEAGEEYSTANCTEGSGNVSVSNLTGNLVEGSFFFTAQNADCEGEPAVVTEGQFRIHLQ